MGRYYLTIPKLQRYNRFITNFTGHVMTHPEANIWCNQLSTTKYEINHVRAQRQTNTESSTDFKSIELCGYYVVIFQSIYTHLFLKMGLLQQNLGLNINIKFRRRDPNFLPNLIICNQMTSFKMADEIPRSIAAIGRLTLNSNIWSILNHYIDVSWASLRLKLLANRLFV